MELYVLVVAGFGVLVLLTAWLPMVLRALPLSLPICCVGIGAALSTIPAVAELTPHPSSHAKLVEHATEAVVVISLMGAGLKIDRLLGWRTWSVTWRLLGIGMPLTILALTVLGSTLLGLGLASALLLASSLAPTDPVLASDVQVGHPDEDHEDEPRFALTSEAGLNDGLAFPFVNLAIAFAGGGLAGLSWPHWLAVDVLWKIAVGAVFGAVVGRALGCGTDHSILTAAVDPLRTFGPPSAPAYGNGCGLHGLRPSWHRPTRAKGASCRLNPLRDRHRTFLPSRRSTDAQSANGSRLSGTDYPQSTWIWCRC